MNRRPRHGSGPSSSRGRFKRRCDGSSSESEYKPPTDEEALLETSDDEADNASKARRRMRVRGDGDAVVETEAKRDNRKKGSNKKGKKKDKPILMWEVWQEENNRWVTEYSGKETDAMDQNNEMALESSEPSDDLIIPLLRYQKEWLAWALKQEESAVRGGILADEMGMGKTLQIIALVLLKRQIQEVYGHDICCSSSASSSVKLPLIKGTLVICPLVAVMLWVGEIERFTFKGSTKVLVYHGSKRERKQYEFSDYDFVITTYSIVEAEYRKLVMPPKEKCHYCGKLFYPNKLSVHLNNICGPSAVKMANQSKQLKKESKTKKASVSEVSAVRAGKKKNMESTEDTDVTNQSQSARESILHSLKWNRIILDEGHYIKARHSNTTRAVLALNSSYKWALSGTPVQNRVGELYSLVRFLQVVPYSYYFCKDCDCRNLDYSTKVECSDCGHSSVRHFCWWNKYIATPIQDYGNTGLGGDAMILLKHKILKSLLLRRTKKGREADLALPTRTVILRRDSLDVVEEDYFTALYNESQAQFNTYIAAGAVLNNYAHIFDLLTRLRQAVDHPYLVEYSRTTMQRKINTVDNVNDEKCSLCQDPEEDAVVTSCGHVFCKPCLIDFNATLGQNSCPSCLKPLTVDFSSNEDSDKVSKTKINGFRASSILNRIQLDCFQTSTKIEALKEEIRSMVERDGSAKGIVFSQFSAFLDLIHYSLQKCGVNCVRLDGSMTMGAREAAIKKFNENPDCRIFLMSLKAGGVALNLTVASHVFLMDPWWNPAAELQAQDRIHRIGQYKPITIVRFIMQNTIEERILKLQEKKELVFEGTVGGSSDALAKLTEADLKSLFVT